MAIDSGIVSIDRLLSVCLVLFSYCIVLVLSGYSIILTAEVTIETSPLHSSLLFHSSFILAIPFETIFVSLFPYSSSLLPVLFLS